MNEKETGDQIMAMGDLPVRTKSTSTETVPAVTSPNATTQVQTVADLKPTNEAIKEEPKAEVKEATPPEELHAHFVRDSVPDGSKLPPSHSFEQTWTLRNPGPHAWPAGCSVRFVGGDNMLNVDPNHPSSVTDLANATESNVIGRSVAVGEEIDFHVVMKTPQREGKSISYWRLKAADGTPFGHKLWCDIDVCRPEPAAVKTELAEVVEDVKDLEHKTEPETEHIEDVETDSKAETLTEESSTMIFPKLDKESPVSSTHEALTNETSTPKPANEEDQDLLEDIESLELEDDETEDGFLTDEEYDILDASDEESLADAHKAQK